MSDVERRSIVVTELRVSRDAGKPPIITGYAARFLSLSADLGGFVEQIDPAAFDWTLTQSPDVRALIDHDSSLILGRTKAGTLRLATDKKGLKVEIDPPNTSYANDLLVSMERGDITQMSFGFRTLEDSWNVEGETPLRTLMKLDLHDGDVSAVTYPAYSATSVSARTIETAKAEALKIPKRDPAADKAKYFAEVRERIAAFRGKK